MYSGEVKETEAGGGEFAPYRMKCIDDGFEKHPPDLLDWNLVSFIWNKRIGNRVEPITTDDRIKMNPKTGG